MDLKVVLFPSKSLVCCIMRENKPVPGISSLPDVYAIPGNELIICHKNAKQNNVFHLKSKCMLGQNV